MAMTFLRFVLLFSLLPGGHDVFAGQADLAIAATLVPSPPYRAGQSVEVPITVTNFGPDVAGEDAVGPLLPVAASATTRFDDPNRMPVTFTTREARLESVPLDPARVSAQGSFYLLYFPRLAVGESRSCTLDAIIDVCVVADRGCRDLLGAGRQIPDLDQQSTAADAWGSRSPHERAKKTPRRSSGGSE